MIIKFQTKNKVTIPRNRDQGQQKLLSRTQLGFVARESFQHFSLKRDTTQTNFSLRIYLKSPLHARRI